MHPQQAGRAQEGPPTTSINNTKHHPKEQDDCLQQFMTLKPVIPLYASDNQNKYIYSNSKYNKIGIIDITSLQPVQVKDKNQGI